MTVQQRGVVDLIAHDPKTDAWSLIIVEERQWDGSAQQLQQLKDKVEDYLQFALDGFMDKHDPDSKGRAKRIGLYCAALPDGATAAFIERLRRFVGTYGLGFDVVQLSDKPA